MRIEAVDPDDDDEVVRWFGPIASAIAADWPDGPPWRLQERRALVRQHSTMRHLLAIATERSGEVVGSLQVRLTLRESQDVGDIEVVVDPGARGRGVGAALLEYAEGAAVRHGRTTAVGTSEAPLGSLEAVRQEQFARRAGYEPALVEARRELHLPLDWSHISSLEIAARPHASAYEIVTWTGPCPERWERGRIAVARAISTDAPSGELSIQEEDWDVERLRDFEKTVDDMGRDTIAAAAIDAGGALVAFSEIGVGRPAARYAFQFDTIVLPAHRGHRLGLLCKIANLRALCERAPQIERILTVNAAHNEPMVRVNELLGFTLVGTGTVWKRKLG